MVDSAMVRERLASARLYLCTDARRRQNDLAQFVEAACAGGVDIVQLREKNLDTTDELDALAVIGDVCSKANVLWAVNDRPELAASSGAPVLHLGQDDLPVPFARDLLGEAPIIGRSSHSFDQATAAALQTGVDYFAVGPVWETPTKPGRPAIGLDVIGDVADWARGRPEVPPWFAIGGIDRDTVEQVVANGAERIVVVRAITQADDPEQAAGDLLAKLAPFGYES